MKKLLDRLRPYSEKCKCVNVVVETPKDSRLKYAYDDETGLFQLNRALPGGSGLPLQFRVHPFHSRRGRRSARYSGAESGSVVPWLPPTSPGFLHGVIKVKQTEKSKTYRNDRLVGLAIPKETPTALENFTLTKETLFQIEQFFITYNKLDGKKLKILGYGGPKQAKQIVRQGIVKRIGSN